jgi:hypothetical protein
MAVVRLGPKGGVGVITPPTAEEIVEAEAGLMRVVGASHLSSGRTQRSLRFTSPSHLHR